MAFELDDLLKDDKKDANLVPDLSKATCSSQEEFRRLLEHCPEFKIKSEKVKREDIKIRDKEFSWRATKKELKAIEKEWAYGDPIPPDMKGLNLRELQQVAIDWRMLTPIRPKFRQDEDIFSRLVEMGKLEARTRMKERRTFASPIRRSKNRAGVIESSVKICGECGEEYCFSETCGDIFYDSYIRIVVPIKQSKTKISADTEAIIANMNRPKKQIRRKLKTKSKTSKKSARLLIHHKTRKSINKNNKSNRRESNLDETVQPVRQFKRKCTKYRRKGQSRK